MRPRTREVFENYKEEVEDQFGSDGPVTFDSIAEAPLPSFRSRLEIVEPNAPFQRFQRKLPWEVWLASVTRDEPSDSPHVFSQLTVERRRVAFAVGVETARHEVRKRRRFLRALRLAVWFFNWQMKRAEQFAR